MDPTLHDDIREIRDDVKKLIPLIPMVNDHHATLYGNGHDGIVTDVTKLKSSHKLYNKIFAGVGSVLTFFFGNLAWRWYGGR